MPGTKLMECYGQELVQERHRHRYREFNNEYRQQMVDAGLVLGGTSPTAAWRPLSARLCPLRARSSTSRVQERPLRAQPLFRGFVSACLKKARGAGRGVSRLSGRCAACLKTGRQKHRFMEGTKRTIV